MPSCLGLERRRLDFVAPDEIGQGQLFGCIGISVISRLVVLGVNGDWKDAGFAAQVDV